MNTVRVRLPRFVMAALFALVLGLLAACYPLPTWGPGSPNYHCADYHRTIWLSERPINVRFASFTVGMSICTMYGVTILSAAPYYNLNQMGFYTDLMNTGTDYVRTDVMTGSTVTVEGGAYAQECASGGGFPVLCSFMDHVHLWVSWTSPVSIGPLGGRVATDRGDISVWWTP